MAAMLGAGVGGLVSGLAAGVPLVQSDELHKNSLKHSTHLHREGLSHAAQYHCEALHHSQHQHAQAITQAETIHKQQLTLNIHSARRENLRDVWAQKNHKAQTLMITDTLMFGCGFALLVEGQPPEAPNAPSSTFLTFYMIAVGTCFWFLLASLWFAMRLQSRLTKFNMYNPRQLYSCGREHSAFEEYYKCHCAQVAYFAIISFYFGTGFLMIAASLFVWMRFGEKFASTPAGIAFCLLSAASLITLYILHRFFPARTLIDSRKPVLPLHDLQSLASFSLSSNPHRMDFTVDDTMEACDSGAFDCDDSGDDSTEPGPVGLSRPHHSDGLRPLVPRASSMELRGSNAPPANPPAPPSPSHPPGSPRGRDRVSSLDHDCHGSATCILTGDGQVTPSQLRLFSEGDWGQRDGTSTACQTPTYPVRNRSPKAGPPLLLSGYDPVFGTTVAGSIVSGSRRGSVMSTSISASDDSKHNDGPAVPAFNVPEKKRMRKHRLSRWNTYNHILGVTAKGVPPAVAPNVIGAVASPPGGATVFNDHIGQVTGLTVPTTAVPMGGRRGSTVAGGFQAQSSRGCCAHACLGCTEHRKVFEYTLGAQSRKRLRRRAVQSGASMDALRQRKSAVQYGVRDGGDLCFFEAEGAEKPVNPVDYFYAGMEAEGIASDRGLVASLLSTVMWPFRRCRRAPAAPSAAVAHKEQKPTGTQRSAGSKDVSAPVTPPRVRVHANPDTPMTERVPHASTRLEGVRRQDTPPDCTPSYLRVAHTHDDTQSSSSRSGSDVSGTAEGGSHGKKKQKKKKKCYCKDCGN